MEGRETFPKWENGGKIKIFIGGPQPDLKTIPALGRAQSKRSKEFEKVFM